MHLALTFDAGGGSVDVVTKQLGDTDRRLLAALQLDGRASWQVIASSVGASESTVQRRYQILRERGAARVVGVVDVLRCGLGVPVLVRFSCRPGRAEAVVSILAARPEVRFAALLTGSSDAVAEIVVPSYGDVTHMLTDLATDGDITNSETLVVMRTFTSAHDWDMRLLDPDSAALIGARRVLPFEDPAWAQPPDTLDELELAIVATLSEDGRAPFRDVAANVDASESTVRRRIESMLRRGCLRFRTLVEPVLLGFSVEFMLWLDVRPADLEAAGRQLASHPCTKYLSATMGSFNLCGQVSLRDFVDLYPFITDVIGALPGLRGADCTLQLHTLKRAWAPINPDQALIDGTSR